MRGVCRLLHGGFHYDRVLEIEILFLGSRFQIRFRDFGAALTVECFSLGAHKNLEAIGQQSNKEKPEIKSVDYIDVESLEQR